MRHSRAILFIFLVPALMASKCRNKDKDLDPELYVVDDLADIEQGLQIVSIDPAWNVQGQTFKAMVYGTEFQDGAKVRFGEEIFASRVEVLDRNTLSITVPPLSPATWDVHVLNPDGGRATLRSGLAIQSDTDYASFNAGACKDFTIYFEVDSSRINRESENRLNKQLDCLSKGAERVLLEGHADERGTTEYNLALGQRRAESVKTWLATRGVSPSKIRTLSFGEERPAEYGGGQYAWAKNRRVELKLESR